MVLSATHDGGRSPWSDQPAQLVSAESVSRSFVGALRSAKAGWNKSGYGACELLQEQVVENSRDVSRPVARQVIGVSVEGLTPVDHPANREVEKLRGRMQGDHVRNPAERLEGRGDDGVAIGELLAGRRDDLSRVS